VKLHEIHLSEKRCKEEYVLEPRSIVRVVRDVKQETAHRKARAIRDGERPLRQRPQCVVVVVGRGSSAAVAVYDVQIVVNSNLHELGD
jgi:hypothetical protein